MSETTTETTDPAAGNDTAPGGLFDLAEASAPPAKGEDGKAVRPDWLAEQFWDAEKGEARLADLAKSQRDLRAQVSRGDHKPPEKPEAYTLPKIEGLPEGMIGGEKDTLWPELRTAAHAAGVTQKQLEALATPFLREVAKVAKAAPGADSEAEKAALREAYAAEMKALGPNAEAVVRDIGAWLKGMEARGLLSAEEHQALRGVSTAAGMQALGKLRELGGERGIPVEALAAEGMTEADARKMLTEGFAKNDEGMRSRALKALAEMEKRGQLQGR
jgi:hypothetical protein